eukprot:7140092-Prymnesium_polylepis.1
MAAKYSSSSSERDVHPLKPSHLDVELLVHARDLLTVGVADEACAALVLEDCGHLPRGPRLRAVDPSAAQLVNLHLLHHLRSQARGSLLHRAPAAPLVRWLVDGEVKGQRLVLEHDGPRRGVGTRHHLQRATEGGLLLRRALQLIEAPVVPEQSGEAPLPPCAEERPFRIEEEGADGLHVKAVASGELVWSCRLEPSVAQQRDLPRLQESRGSVRSDERFRRQELPTLQPVIRWLRHQPSRRYQSDVAVAQRVAQLRVEHKERALGQAARRAELLRRRLLRLLREPALHLLYASA